MRMKTSKAKAATVPAKKGSKAERMRDTYALYVRRDTIDFRDKMYQPSLKEVPEEIPLGNYLKHKLPVLNQGQEGACTGFGLAAVVNYLLKTRAVNSAKPDASQFMLYHNARIYDEWQGEEYEGSSARGAMKGWHKHGVCTLNLWTKITESINRDIALDSLKRPLGAYYRITATDIVAIHSALAEVGIVYATADVHTGWDPDAIDTRTGIIPFDKNSVPSGGHAFAIVGYDKFGFWIQNSWGTSWGKGGFGRISYDDWLTNANDVWVARLGVPIELSSVTRERAVRMVGNRQTEILTSVTLRPHVISVDNNGKLKSDERFHVSPQGLAERFSDSGTFSTTISSWKGRKKKVVLYAHGGLVSEKDALDVLATNREGMLKDEVYPFMFVWHSDFTDTILNILKDVFTKRHDNRAEGWFSDFMKERLDETLEVIARKPGMMMWNEMKENAVLATKLRYNNITNLSGSTGDIDENESRLLQLGFNPQSAGCQLLEHLRKRHIDKGDIEIHIVSHSAGSIFMGGVVEYLRRNDIPIESCSFWAPACTVDFFEQYYVPSLTTNHIKRAALFTLTGQQELDDTTAIYNKSLLYLLSNSFEEKASPFIDDTERILGMEKYSNLYSKYFDTTDTFIRVVGNSEIQPSKYKLTSNASHHGDFDNDLQTRLSTLRFIKG